MGNSLKHSDHQAWWESNAKLRALINQVISSDPGVDWLDYTINHYYKNRLPIDECISIGCGDGNLERRLARAGMFHHCDGYEDRNEEEFLIAQSKAEINNFGQIDYHRVDIEALQLPQNKYSLAYVEDFLQHIRNLDYVARQVQTSLKQKGLLVVNGYVGPSRFQFSTRQKEISDHCLKLLPIEFRRFSGKKESYKHKAGQIKSSWYLQRLIDKWRDGDLAETIYKKFREVILRTRNETPIKERVNFPTRRDVLAYDQHLAVHSGEIKYVLDKYFDIVEKKDWGGNIFQFLLKDIVQNFEDADPVSDAFLEMIYTIEQALIKAGEFESDFAYIVCSPKPTD
jgi:ubiquinone/menaquinone biosynthesis C-methylase UbiE